MSTESFLRVAASPLNFYRYNYGGLFLAALLGLNKKLLLSGSSSSVLSTLATLELLRFPSIILDTSLDRFFNISRLPG